MLFWDMIFKLRERRGKEGSNTCDQFSYTTSLKLFFLRMIERTGWTNDNGVYSMSSSMCNN